MNAKTYQAFTMAEALAEVKRDLGRDAVILHTRTFRKGGLLGLMGGRSMWEVTATPGANVPRRTPRGQYVPLKQPLGKAAATTPVARPVQPPAAARAPHVAPPSAAPSPPAASPALSDLQEGLCRQVGEIRHMVQNLLTRQQSSAVCGDPPVLAELKAEMLKRDVDETIAGELIQQLKQSLDAVQLADPPTVRQRAVELLIERLPTAPVEVKASADRPRIVTLIGPTGVGKTTTIAKLAANFKLRENLRVGLITVDTYRIAAVDQLRTYAEIIEVPIRAVLTAGELHQAIEAMKDLDVILIDTAGRSQNDQLRLSQLRCFLSAAQADEVHLVVSATANRGCAKRILDRFIPLGANRIIVTKVDEAETFGMILTITGAKVAMSYVTTGQGVPDDISPAEPRRLAECIMGESQYANG